ncbi:hypothetical protein GYMLUDRAFT_252051 [Collybiopsis luxurians FD-317 M1]|uniref:Uncharacterized protein n=1 Tax=Collybiopsis luxurians FD-317 M1 TaxID=944289 RepID=A0A0D0AMG5_9AGAR|nr:hypothetical protein GYMLUDRAFT_252051 [Collybiopsis luxurians FD-317 M1]
MSALFNEQTSLSSFGPVLKKLGITVYPDWAHYIPPPLGPLIMELDLMDPEDWFEFATLAICDPTHTQWCKGYRVWSTGADDAEEETTDEEDEGFSDGCELQTETEENEN